MAWRDYLTYLFFAVLLAVFMRSFIWAPYQVTGGAMDPVLQAGDSVLVRKQSLKDRFDRGEVVVILPQRDEVGKDARRIVAVEGDRVEIKNSQLYVNEVPLVGFGNSVSEELRISTFGPIVVPPGGYFVMGDGQRTALKEGGYWGTLSHDQIVGIIDLIWFSVEPTSSLSIKDSQRIRWGRVWVVPK